MALLRPGCCSFSCSSRVAVARADEQWVTYKDCRYLPNAANDGDSFHVRTAGREYIFRLYFVDAPETDRSVPARLAQQAKYFHASIREALQIGLEAEGFTRKTLSRSFHRAHLQAGCSGPEQASALFRLCR